MMANHKLLLSLTQAKKSPPKKPKPSLESSSDEEEAVVSRAPRAGRARAPVKYFDDSESDDKENENTRDWSGSDDDFVDDDE